MDLVLGLVIGFVSGLAAGFGLSIFWQQRATQAKTTHNLPAPGQKENLLDTILGGGHAAEASPPVQTEAERAESLRQNLRLKFLFDEAKVEQAIAREKEHTPDGTMMQWLEAAVYRWERENR